MWTTVVVACLLGLAAAVPIDIEEYPEEVPGAFEGDIDLLPGDNPFLKNGLRDKSRRWPNGLVPYTIASTYSSSMHTHFREAMSEIETRTRVNGQSCIRFVPRTTQTSYIKFNTGSGCHTPVGWRRNYMATVTIGRGCERKGTIMHELLHSLGFWHEQSRTDRDSYVTIHWSNIQSGHERNFAKYTQSTIDHLGQAYDFESVMHYPATAFAIDRTKPTIEPKGSNVVIGQRTHLSPTDIKEIQLLYGCISANQAGHTTSGPTLAITNVPVTHTNAPSLTAETCTFEHGMCGWTQETTDQTNFVIWHGRTPSSNTGPSYDHNRSTSAKYLYLEASGTTQKSARLLSRTYGPSHYCIDFYYHMYGADIGYLKFYALSGSHRYILKSVTGNHNNNWYHTRFGINVSSGSFKFEIEAHTGSGYRSDIAIDDLTIHAGSC
ncbi:hypothetical protein ScPMuIL_005111 [Solemya velum]